MPAPLPPTPLPDTDPFAPASAAPWPSSSDEPDWESLGTAARRTLGALELRCPPLPQTLVEAVDLVDHPARLDARSVTALIQRDPVVVTRLLHTVNSAYYGLRQTVSEPERAVVMLGPVAVAGIVLGMHLLKLPSALEGPASGCYQRLIRHSLATGYLSRVLVDGTPPAARAAGPPQLGLAFTAGLLHDLGRLVLVYNFPDEAARLYDERSLEGQVEGQDEREVEQLVFGCDHVEAGEYAARKFNLPGGLVDVLRTHHAPETLPAGHSSTQLVHAVAAADLAAKGMGFAVGPAPDWDDTEDDPCWAAAAKLLRRFDGARALRARLEAERSALDAYVTELTALPDDYADRARLVTHARLRSLACL